MEAALQAFLVTIAIVGGVLSPILIIAFLGAAGNMMKAIAAEIIKQGEEAKKLPPFDDVELNLNPATRVLTGRIIKDNKILWQGSVTRNTKDAE